MTINGRVWIGVAIALLLLAVGSWSELQAQTGTYFNQRDDQYRLLGLKRAKEAFEVARTDFSRQNQLFDRGLITKVELDHARSNLSDAEVNYHQSLLAVLFERQYVTVTAAVKYYAPNGSRHVRLTLANASGGSAEYRKLLNIDDQLFRSLQPDVINDIYVSLLNKESSIIGKPYEQKVTQLEFGQPVDISFRLLEDVDNVTVSLIYGNGTQRSMSLLLEKDISTNKVTVQSEQFSQEVDLGRTASYDLGLELYSGTDNTFTLDVANLPTEINRTFRDPSSGARLNQLRFTESTRTKRAVLDITLPDRAGGALCIDTPIQFLVIVFPPNQARTWSHEQGLTWTPAQLDSMDIGYVCLELIPRGKGILRVQADQLFHAVKSGESAYTNLQLLNEGSSRIDNIQIRLDLPLQWKKRITPGMVTGLDAAADTMVQVVLYPPDKVTAGRYDIRVRTTGQSNGQTLDGEDKTITVEVQPGTSLLGTLSVVVLIAGLVVGMVVFGIKLSRK